MAADMRPFQAVNTSMPSVESGAERFVRDGNIRRPGAACYRLNLTALSQKYNLYFVATVNEIQVYEPEFPFQKLGGRPSLTISPQLANSNAAGYINTHSPHCINHVLVGSLGTQEILLLSTDSGNVTAYHTSAIVNAIYRHNHDRSSHEGPSYFEIRPFFSQWVYESAWGLAIHEHGRMIAVSANTPHHFQEADRSSKITVFAFALSEREGPEDDVDVLMDLDSGSSDSLEDWTAWNPAVNQVGDSPNRDRNYKIVLAGEHGHTRNVPCVTFFNDKQDKEGSWLLSTDIVGSIKMWRIWKGVCFRTWNYAAHTRGSRWLQHTEAGWFVAALNTDAFRPATTNDTLIGHCRAAQYHGYNTAGESFDITHLVENFVPSNNIVYPSDEATLNDTETEQDALFEDFSDSEATADEEETAHIERIVNQLNTTFSSSSQTADLSQNTTSAGPQTPPQSRVVSPRHRLMADHGLDDNSDEVSDLDTQLPGDQNEYQDLELTSDFSHDEMSDTDDNDDSNPSVRSVTSNSSYNPRSSQESDNNSAEGSPSMRRNAKPQASPRIVSKPPQNMEIPETPFIHCSTSQLRLYSSTKAGSPHLFCARMLSQRISLELEGMPFVQMDRLSIVEQIPELGIIIVASQVGRCAVCTLTKRQSDGLLGLRVDCILPTRADEQAGLRPPGCWLLGIATSPIQGRFPTETGPSSEQNNDDSWSTDRVINGTPTSFDRHVVKMIGQQVVGRHGSSNMVGRSQGKSSTGQGSTYRNRHNTQVDILDTSPPALGPHRWLKSGVSESWGTVEPSRRYRLMMTYADMTVLTYEIARGVEKSDVKERTHIHRQ